MSIRVGDIIKHEKFTDVACLVTGVGFKEDVLNLQIVWVNQGFDKTYNIDFGEIRIASKNLPKWLVCEDPDAKCIRHSKWKHLTKI